MLEGQHHAPGLPAVNEIVRLRKLECYSDYKDSELTLVCSRVRSDTFDAVPRRAGGWQVTRVPPEHIEGRNLGTQDLSKRGQGQTARTQRKRKRSTNGQRKSAVVSSGTAVGAAVGTSDASALNDEDEVEVEAMVEECGNGDGGKAGAHAPASAPQPPQPRQPQLQQLAPAAPAHDAPSAAPSAPAPSPLAVLQQLEDLNFGAPQQGGLIPRISALEAQEFGAPRQGNVKSRVQALRDHFTAEIGA